MVVVAHRADRQTARAVPEGAHHPQQSLPETEHVPGADRAGFFRGRSVDEAVEKRGDGAIAELLGFCGAGALVDAEMQHGVGRAGIQAARTRFADAHLFGHRPVRLQLQLGQHAGQVDPGAVLGREQVHLQPDGAQPGLDAQVAGAEPPVAGLLVVPVGLLGGGDEAGMPGGLQASGQAVGDLVHPPQHQHVHVLHRDVVLGPEDRHRYAMHDHDHALAIGRDPIRGLGPLGVRRKSVERRRAGDAHQVRPQLQGHPLDLRRIHGNSSNSVGFRRPWASVSIPVSPWRASQALTIPHPARTIRFNGIWNFHIDPTLHFSYFKPSIFSWGFSKHAEIQSWREACHAFDSRWPSE